METDTSCLINIHSYSGPAVTLPDSEQIAPSQKILLSLSNKLSTEVRTVTALSELKLSSLISLGHLYDDAFIVILNKDKIIALKIKNVKFNYDENEVLFEETRNSLDGLWDMPTNDSIKLTLQKEKNKASPLHSFLFNNTKTPARKMSYALI